MKRPRFKRTVSPADRLAAEAKRLCEEAERLPRGAAREELIRQARRAATASHVNDWVDSPGLKPPK
jgi:hypothetical protein